MAWANGITYEGRWRDGKYDGDGTKSYSRGGGYAGQWKAGARHGWGTSLYDGKWGYERWVGPFENDEAHGVGTMYLRELDAVEANAEQRSAVPFEFDRGKPLTH